MKRTFEIESAIDDDIDESVACSYDSVEDLQKHLLEEKRK